MILTILKCHSHPMYGVNTQHQELSLIRKCQCCIEQTSSVSVCLLCLSLPHRFANLSLQLSVGFSDLEILVIPFLLQSCSFYYLLKFQTPFDHVLLGLSIVTLVLQRGLVTLSNAEQTA